MIGRPAPPAPAPPADHHLRWAEDGRDRPVAWPLGLSILEDALEPALEGALAATPPDADRSAGAPPGPTDPLARWLLLEAWRRVAVRNAIAAPPAPPDIDTTAAPLAGTVGALLRDRIAPGPWHDPLGPTDHAALLPLDPGDWVTVGRCGAWKDARIARVFDERFGTGGWRTGYSWGPLTLDERSGIQIYEDAYRRALQRNEALLDWLIGHGEVYDTDPSNIASYCDYGVQEKPELGQHWQDVALRRALRRMGRWFAGRDRLEVRGRESAGYRLNPGQLPFHAPARLVAPRQYGWWGAGSIEEFSIGNFCVQAPLQAVRAWVAADPSEPERCRTLLLAQHPALHAELARAAAGNARAQLSVARAVSLMPEGTERAVLQQIASPDPVAAMLEVVRDPRATEAADRLLSDNPLTRRGLFDDLDAHDPALARWILGILAADPARRVRNRAAALQGQAGKRGN